jgi:SAM-dependent methyltransferase
MKKIIAFLIRFIPRKYLQYVAGPGLKVLAFMNRGNDVTCPICEHSYKKFLPYGRLSPRENALCPNCLSLERHRLIWLYLKQSTDFFKHKSHVLHIAPEACFIKRFERIHEDAYITGDLDSPLAKVKMDIHEMPFEENTFDVVICNHVLEHVHDDIKAISEIVRVLKPGGWSILQVPFYAPVPDETFADISITDPRERERLFGQSDHVRKFGMDYGQRIEREGLSVTEHTFAFDLTDEQVTKFSIIREKIFIGTKPGHA